MADEEDDQTTGGMPADDMPATGGDKDEEMEPTEQGGDTETTGV